MNTARHRIPATSANLGPGYDCLGVALTLHNTVEVCRVADRAAPHAMVDEAGAVFFEKSRVSPFLFDWKIWGDVPMSCGLGSSVTLRLGILHGLNKLCGSPLERDGVYQLCVALEGHPDNAAPAEYGGFVAAGNDGGFFQFEVDSDLAFVVLVPPMEMLTSEARRVLPEQIPHQDAVRNTANACRITAAFASEQYEMLRGAFEDYLHQSYRAPLLPFFPEVIQAGTKAGALGGYLSGSGSAIACVTLEDPDAVAAAMLASCEHEGARVMVLSVDNSGIISV